jgi:hypothetical protein
VTIYSKNERSDGDSTNMPQMPGIASILGTFGKIAFGGEVSEEDLFKSLGIKPGQGRDKLTPPPPPHVPESFGSKEIDKDWFLLPGPKEKGSSPEGEVSGPSSDL